MRLTLGGQMKLMRLQSGISQATLSERSNLSRTIISQIENDHANPSISTLQRFAQACNATLSVSFSFTSSAGDLDADHDRLEHNET
jgi:transcriptional regulator with XRE-family HTH domain